MGRDTEELKAVAEDHGGQISGLQWLEYNERQLTANRREREKQTEAFLGGLDKVGERVDKLGSTILKLGIAGLLAAVVVIAILMRANFAFDGTGEGISISTSAEAAESVESLIDTDTDTEFVPANVGFPPG